MFDTCYSGYLEHRIDDNATLGTISAQLEAPCTTSRWLPSQTHSSRTIKALRSFTLNLTHLYDSLILLLTHFCLLMDASLWLILAYWSITHCLLIFLLIQLLMSPYDSFWLLVTHLMTHYLFSLLSDAHSACLLYFSLTHYYTIFSMSPLYKKTAPGYLQSPDLS
jgi:hypothetical protein